MGSFWVNHVITILILTTFCTANERSKRAAYELPSGYELIVGSVSTSFTCQSDGYYADTANGCQLFHVCQTHNYPDGRTELVQDSFVCGNQTVFDQLHFTCEHPEFATPCEDAPSFFYLNQKIGQFVPFHDDNDLATLVARRITVQEARYATGGGGRVTGRRTVVLDGEPGGPQIIDAPRPRPRPPAARGRPAGRRGKK